MRVQKCAQREANLLFFFCFKKFRRLFFLFSFFVFFSVDGKIRDEPSSALNKTTNWLNVGRQKKTRKNRTPFRPPAGGVSIFIEQLFRFVIYFQDTTRRRRRDGRFLFVFFVCFFLFVTKISAESLSWGPEHSAAILFFVVLFFGKFFRRVEMSFARRRPKTRPLKKNQNVFFLVFYIF